MRYSTARPFMRLALLTLVATSACGGGGNRSPIIITAPTQAVTETFSGTLTRGATVVHPFNAQAAGDLTISVVTVAPVNTLVFGLGLGVWDGTSCSVQLSTPQATQGNTFNASVSVAGRYCLAVVDAGNIAEGDTVTYSLTLTHP